MSVCLQFPLPGGTNQAMAEPIRLVQPLHNVNMYMFLFCLLDDRIALSTLVCLFFAEGNSSPLLKQQLPELEGFHDS